MFSQQMKFSALVKINKHKNLSDSQIPSVGVGGGSYEIQGFKLGFANLQCQNMISMEFPNWYFSFLIKGILWQKLFTPKQM